MSHDTGTGGDKAVLTDLRGRIVDSAYRAYGLNYPRPDWAKQDPNCATSLKKKSKSARIRGVNIQPLDRLQVLEIEGIEAGRT